MINPELKAFIDKVKESTDIVQVIGQRIPLDSNNKAKCPFHDEKNPSFSANSEGQYFRCFGCGKSGDVFKFIMFLEGKTFMEALSVLASQAGIPFPYFTPEDIKQIEERRNIAIR